MVDHAHHLRVEAGRGRTAWHGPFVPPGDGPSADVDPGSVPVVRASQPKEVCDDSAREFGGYLASGNLDHIGRRHRRGGSARLLGGPDAIAQEHFTATPDAREQVRT